MHGILLEAKSKSKFWIFDYVEGQNQWRVKYLGLLLEQRQTWHYRGDKENANVVQHLIDSLCIN